MSQLFIKNIKINKVRHLENINIPVSTDECKHIIFTGKNGSGKTSVLDAVAVFINSITTGDNPAELSDDIKATQQRIELYIKDKNESYILKDENNLTYCATSNKLYENL